MRKHVAPLIGDHPIGSLNAEVLDSFYAELRRCRDHCDGQRHVCKSLAAGTIRHIHYLLSAAYENAIRWEWVAVNPMRRARKPAAPRPDPQPPTAEEAVALVTESWPHPHPRRTLRRRPHHPKRTVQHTLLTH